MQGGRQANVRDGACSPRHCYTQANASYPTVAHEATLPFRLMLCFAHLAKHACLRVVSPTGVTAQLEHHVLFLWFSENFPIPQASAPCHKVHPPRHSHCRNDGQAIHATAETEPRFQQASGADVPAPARSPTEVYRYYFSPNHLPLCEYATGDESSPHLVSSCGLCSTQI